MENLEGIIRIVLGDREYELLPILRDGEETITWAQLTQRAQTLSAQLGEEDVELFLTHQVEIPIELEKLGLIFTEWHLVRGYPCLRCRPARWWQRGGKKWIADWFFIGGRHADGRLVRRVK